MLIAPCFRTAEALVFSLTGSTTPLPIALPDASRMIFFTAGSECKEMPYAVLMFCLHFWDGVLVIPRSSRSSMLQSTLAARENTMTSPSMLIRPGRLATYSAGVAIPEIAGSSRHTHKLPQLMIRARRTHHCSPQHTSAGKAMTGKVAAGRSIRLISCQSSMCTGTMSRLRSR